LELKRVGILAVVASLDHKIAVLHSDASQPEGNDFGVKELENTMDGYTRMVVRHCKGHHSIISLYVRCP